MSKVKIETLTPIHIGTGNTLYNGMDYVLEGGKAYFLDNNKLLDIIGIDKIDAWVAAIERGDNISSFISRIGKNAHPCEYSRRNAVCNVASCNTIKENIHDGRGLAYIPGSSIKGAIRTAILAAEMEGRANEYTEYLENKKKGVLEKKCPKDSVSKKVEDDCFSNKDFPKLLPNTSCMRFLQVGDAYFETGCGSILNAINLNIRERDSLLDKDKSQAIETLNAGSETVFELRLKVDAMPLKSGVIHPLPPSMESLEILFDTINKHTKSLLKGELDYWNEISEEKTGAESYIKSIKDLLEKVKEAQKRKECILRVGHASGWRFTTGSWTEQLDDEGDNFFDIIVPISRPNDWKYKQYEFPKTRRVYEVGNDVVNVLGFVKLTLV